MLRLTDESYQLELRHSLSMPAVIFQKERLSVLGPWSSECGQGWVADHLSSKCYFFSEEAKNWNDARKQCQSMQSDLMSVSTKYDQTFLQGEII